MTIDYDALDAQAQQIVKEISEFLPSGWTYTYKMSPGQWTVYIVRLRGRWDAGDRTIACHYAFDLMQPELNKGFSSMKEILLIRQCLALSDVIEFLTRQYASAES